MTDQELEKRCWELAGWKLMLHGGLNRFTHEKWGVRPHPGAYARDLNATWELEEVVKARGLHWAYLARLLGVPADIWNWVHASAREKAEAFVAVMEAAQGKKKREPRVPWPVCPLCGANLREGDGSRVIGIIKHDRIDHWQCPDCGGEWPRGTIQTGR